MRHVRGDDRKALNKRRILAKYVRNHNRYLERWHGDLAVFFEGTEDVPEKELKRIYADEGKKAQWHCDPRRCSYCLRSRTHKNDICEQAQEEELKLWLLGRLE